MLGAKKRNRTRTACIPCQIRKRKCSGTQPCMTCAHLRTECQYDRRDQYPLPLQQQSSPRNALTHTAGTGVTRDPLTAFPSQKARMNSVEANSGAAFARKLGLKADPNLAPKLNMFAWNLGLRHVPASATSSAAGARLSIVDIITHDEMRFLSAVYFEKVHPYYPFLDREILSFQIKERWLPTSNAAVPFTAYEGILCGVAALGSLFSRREPNEVESKLLETARFILESHLCFHLPSLDIITAWVLRVSYLRIAGIPHLAWITSCTLMHLIEAAGLHMELNVSEVLAEKYDNTSLETRRRLFGIARHFNLWFSFELGRTRIKFPTASTKLPETSNDTKDIFSFLALSESLDPDQAHDIPTLERTLVEIMNVGDLQPPMILTQCNLMLCVHRRLQSQNVSISGEIYEQFLGIVRQGLRATQEMVISHCPWHTVANVPFQIICALLSMDTHESISLLSEAMKTLQQVMKTYNTDVMREAYDAAFLLVKVHQHRKEQDVKSLSEIVQTEISPTGSDSQITNILDGSELIDQSSHFWLNNAILGSDGFQLDPLLMVDDPWPNGSFPTE